MTETIGVYDRIENVKSIMDNLEDWEDVDIEFTHLKAFEVNAYVVAKHGTTMDDLSTIDKILTEHGFEEIESPQYVPCEWAYKWHHSNY